MSTNGGRSWRTFNQGLTNLSVDQLVISSHGEALYAGTSGGVFDYRFGG